MTTTYHGVTITEIEAPPIDDRVCTGEYIFRFEVDTITGEKTCLITEPPPSNISLYHVNQIRLYCEEGLRKHQTPLSP